MGFSSSPMGVSSCRLVDPANNLYMLLLSRMGPCSSTSWRTPRGRENTPTPADSPSTAKQFLSYFKNGLFPTSFALFSSTISQCRDSNCASLVSEVTDLPIEPPPQGWHRGSILASHLAAPGSNSSILQKKFRGKIINVTDVK